MLVRDAITKFCEAYCPSAKGNIETFVATYVGGLEDNYFEILSNLCCDKFFVSKRFNVADGTPRVDYSYVHYTSVKHYRSTGEYGVKTYVSFEGVALDKFSNGKWSKHEAVYTFFSTVSKSGMLRIDLVEQIEDFEHEWQECTKETYDNAVNEWIANDKKVRDCEYELAKTISSKQTKVEKVNEEKDISNLISAIYYLEDERINDK